jgi:DNA-binding transcriptional LysR family regulator
MWPAVELREIHVFLTLSEELHFGRTADRLHLTSSRISQILRELEGKLGAELVRRTSRRVELTAFGERFRHEAGRAYAELADTVRRAQVANRMQLGPLQLGLFADPGASKIPRIVKAFEHAHPEWAVQAVEVPIQDPFGPLHRGEFDLIASWLPHGQSGLVIGPMLSSEPRVLAVAADHPLADAAGVSIEDLAHYRVMRFETMPTEFHEVWIPSRTPSGRRVEHQAFSAQSLGDRGRMTSELVHLIATGHVVHPTVPSFANMFGHPDIAYVPIVDMPPLRSALVWRRDRTDPRLLEFARVAEEVVAAGHARQPAA